MSRERQVAGDRFDAYREMAAQGIQFFPLRPRSKVPAEKGYLHKLYRPPEIKAALLRGCNVGVNIKRSGLLVIDVDPRNGGDASINQLQRDFIFPDTPIVWSGRGDGGHHIYLRAPQGVRLPAKVAAYPGIDFKGSGHVAAPGSFHPNTCMPYTVDSWFDFTVPIAETPVDLVVALGRQPVAKPRTTATPAIGNDALAQLLSVLDPRDYSSSGSEDWFRLMCACHDATAGEGIEEFIEWCAGDPDYADEHHIQLNRRRWASVRAASDSDLDLPTTKATLFRAVIDAGHGDKIAALGFDAASGFDDALDENYLVYEIDEETDHG